MRLTNLEPEADFDAALLANLTIEEAERLQAYDDATGKTLRPGDTLKGNLTIGIGRNLTSRGLSKDETHYLAGNDIALVKAALDRAYPWWRALPMPARLAMADMGFNMGVSRLGGFVDMLAALQAATSRARSPRCAIPISAERSPAARRSSKPYSPRHLRRPKPKQESPCRRKSRPAPRSSRASAFRIRSPPASAISPSGRTWP
jgi:GH24 family phage-related lysozyme (muramidase)